MNHEQLFKDLRHLKTLRRVSFKMHDLSSHNPYSFQFYLFFNPSLLYDRSKEERVLSRWAKLICILILYHNRSLLYSGSSIELVARNKAKKIIVD